MIRRREFIKSAALGLAGATLAHADLPAPINFRLAGKNVLTQSDFSYLGAFYLPTASGGYGTGWGFGLAFRYVSGELRFFSTTGRNYSAPNKSLVYEVVYPGYALSSYPTATVSRHWGDIYHDKHFTDDAQPFDGFTMGLYWDPIDTRLYWSYLGEYTNTHNNPFLGYSVLNDGNGSSVAHGPYRPGYTGSDHRSFKSMCGGITPLPSWFQSYVGGKRFGIGFGGRQSAAGPMSVGPALWAIDPPAVADNANIPSATELVFYNFTEHYCRRPGNYVDHLSYMDPVNGVGYWQWTDMLMQSSVWIDTPTKHGFLTAGLMGHGTISYYGSDFHWDDPNSGLDHWWFVMNPSDIVAVAQGQKNPYDVVPSYWQVNYPSYSYPFDPNSSGQSVRTARGIAFDNSTNRLYVAVWDYTTWQPMVLIYQVS